MLKTKSWFPVSLFLCDITVGLDDITFWSVFCHVSDISGVPYILGSLYIICEMSHMPDTTSHVIHETCDKDHMTKEQSLSALERWGSNHWTCTQTALQSPFLPGYHCHANDKSHIGITRVFCLKSFLIGWFQTNCWYLLPTGNWNWLGMISRNTINLIHYSCSRNIFSHIKPYLYLILYIPQDSEINI